MKTMLVTMLVLFMAMVACGKGGKEEKPICGMQKAEAEAIEKKIRGEYNTAKNRYEVISAKYIDQEIPDDIKKGREMLVVLGAMNELPSLSEIFDLKNPHEVTLKLFSIVNELDLWAILYMTHKGRDEFLNKFKKVLAEYQVNKILDCHVNNLRQQVSKLDKVKYAKTLELYSLLVQAKSLYDEPKDSYRSMTKALNELAGNFDKTKALAELEWE